MKCQLRVTREVPTGLLKISGNVTFIKEPFLQIKLFYRYTGGYRHWLIDYTFSVCRAEREGNIYLGHKFIERVYKGIKSVLPDLVKGCPYRVRNFL